MTTPPNASPARRRDTLRPLLLVGLVLACIGAAFALLPAPNEPIVQDVRAHPVAAEPLAAPPAAFDTVPRAAEVFADGSDRVADALAPTF